VAYYYNVTICTPGGYEILVRRVPKDKIRQCEHGETWFIDDNGTRHEVIMTRLVGGMGAESSELAQSVRGSAMGSRAADRLERGVRELMTAYVEEMDDLGYSTEQSRQALLEMVGESAESILQGVSTRGCMLFNC
jgi:hypothetical protein|tara:strand:- start:4020 stop:4424 length:405 start_codon:yes stop_codon:yes gene_type:complete